MPFSFQYKSFHLEKKFKDLYMGEILTSFINIDVNSVTSKDFFQVYQSLAQALSDFTN